jgi:hypothetical protein
VKQTRNGEVVRALRDNSARAREATLKALSFKEREKEISASLCRNSSAEYSIM